MQDICAHEFLHILTPLNIHSEEIENFDFRHPKMSQHLWMYEGITEYFSWLVMMQDSIVTVEDFQEEMARKITRSAAHGWFSYTEMSKNVLDKKNQDLYMDVYSGGALLGWMLDLELLKLSNGEYSLRDLMMELAAKYGPSKPFKDDELFDEIEAMTCLLYTSPSPRD